ncbi:MAG: hypothetical protein KKF30_07590 [Proteobacteria bacterium]|nr:hypothetical protein [Pseudomonadota bacterium]MBU4470269.1 hypothetical protein [Pseudomonadota bacterium]MCG2752683.1 hypothetical protein [Desulfobacteraceae bacterium]
MIFDCQGKNALMQFIERRSEEMGLRKQSDLADYCGVDRAPVNRFSKGHGISSENIDKILDRLGLWQNLDAPKSGKGIVTASAILPTSPAPPNEWALTPKAMEEYPELKKCIAEINENAEVERPFPELVAEIKASLEKEIRLYDLKKRTGTV